MFTKWTSWMIDDDSTKALWYCITLWDQEDPERREEKLVWEWVKGVSSWPWLRRGGGKSKKIPRGGRLRSWKMNGSFQEWAGQAFWTAGINKGSEVWPGWCGQGPVSVAGAKIGVSEEKPQNVSLESEQGQTVKGCMWLRSWDCVLRESRTIDSFVLF